MLIFLSDYEMNGVRMQIAWAKPMLKKKDSTAPKFPDKQSVSEHTLSHHASGAMENFNPICAPSANYAYPVPPQTWSYLPVPTFPYAPYQ